LDSHEIDWQRLSKAEDFRSKTGLTFHKKNHPQELATAQEGDSVDGKARALASLFYFN
jgi:hypothetical protein